MNDSEGFMQHYMKQIGQHESVEVKKPMFEPGDVVCSFTEKYKNNLREKYFVKKVTISSNGDKPSEYMYEVAMIDNPDKSYTFKENNLKKLYHDKNWEGYVTEYAGNE